MELGEIINTDFPYATMADIDVLPLTGIGVRYRKIVTFSDDVNFVLVYWSVIYTLYIIRFQSTKATHASYFIFY